MALGEIARRDIVDDGVACNVVESRFERDPPSALADDDAELDFPIDFFVIQEEYTPLRRDL